MLHIYSSALQGLTEFAWRNAHSKIFGYIDKYYAPFMRIEHGKFRNKDLREISHDNNDTDNLVPQIIATNASDSQMMIERILQEGYKEIDINFGCPFPPICKHGQGAGMMNIPDKMAETLKALEQYRNNCVFSIKCRLGINDADGWKVALPIFNAFRPVRLAVHPRTAKQQYSGDLDMESFDAIYHAAEMPLVYNGNIMAANDIDDIERRYPKLDGVMIGRGLMCNPAIAREHAGGKGFSLEEYLRLMAIVANHFENTLCGDAHTLAKIKPYWEYAPECIDRKILKAIKKSTSMIKYHSAVQNIQI